MKEKIIQDKLSFDKRKNFKKSRLDILTEENDLLLISLKRPSGLYRAGKN